MSYLADAHRDWHNVYGWNQVCPLDCGIGDFVDYPVEDEDLAESEERDFEAEDYGYYWDEDRWPEYPDPPF